MKIGILGGGLAGVCLQKHLKHDSEVLEKDARIGGLCRSYEKNGFVYDVGGHILFSKNAEVMEYVKGVLGAEFVTKRRANKVLFKDRYVKYPFENDLGSLDKQDAYECLIGYLVNNHPKPTNLKEWMRHMFGDGIADKYLIPYNEKIWKYPLDKMSLEWVERVPKPPLQDVVKSALGISTEGYTHQLNFGYPAHGGVETLVKSVAKGDGRKIQVGFEVTKIARSGAGWKVCGSKGEKAFDRLVVAMPIIDAARRIEGAPPEVLAAVDDLKYNSIRIVMIGVNDTSLMDKTAIYIPDPSILPHRLCFMGAFSENNVPKGCSSLIAEITLPPGHELLKVSDQAITDRVIEDLEKLKILKRSDVVATDVRNEKYAYIVYDLNYAKNMKLLRAWFDSLGIELLGRFAEFDYINTDEVIRRALKLADKLNAQGVPA